MNLRSASFWPRALSALILLCAACASTVTESRTDGAGNGGGGSSAGNAQGGSDGSGGGTATTTSAGGSPMECGPVCDGCDVTHNWSAGFEGLDVQAVVPDGSGGLVVAGNVAQAVDLGGGVLENSGPQSAVVARYDTSGAHVWSRVFGNAEYVGATAMAPGPDGSVVVVGFMEGAVDFGGGPVSGKTFLLKLDASGQHVFSRAFPTAGPWPASLDAVDVDATGAIVVAGGVQDPVDFGGGFVEHSGNGVDLALARFDSGGHHAWSRTYLTHATASFYRAAWDADGGLRVVGLFNLWAELGDATLTANGGVFVATLDGQGNHIASRMLTASYQLIPIAIDVDAAGDTVLTGAADGSDVDFGLGPIEFQGSFLAKYGPGAEYRWHHAFPSSEPNSITNAYGTGLATAANGDIVLVAQANQPDFGGGPVAWHGGVDGDIAIARFDACGRHLWSRSVGPADDFDIGRAAWAPGGDVLLAGVFTGPTDLGGGDVSVGRAGGWIARMTP